MNDYFNTEITHPTLVTRITEVLQFAVMGVMFFHVMVPIRILIDMVKVMDAKTV